MNPVTLEYYKVRASQRIIRSLRTKYSIKIMKHRSNKDRKIFLHHTDKGILQLLDKFDYIVDIQFLPK